MNNAGIEEYSGITNPVHKGGMLNLIGEPESERWRHIIVKIWNSGMHNLTVSI